MQTDNKMMIKTRSITMIHDIVFFVKMHTSFGKSLLYYILKLTEIYEQYVKTREFFIAFF